MFIRIQRRIGKLKVEISLQDFSDHSNNMLHLWISLCRIIDIRKPINGYPSIGNKRYNGIPHKCVWYVFRKSSGLSAFHTELLNKSPQITSSI